LLATAKEDPLAGLGCVFEGRYARVLVTAIAERLLAALATRTPEVGFSFFNFDGVWRFLRYDGCCHVPALACLTGEQGGRVSSAVCNAIFPYRENSGAFCIAADAHYDTERTGASYGVRE
jgi:hypothetical protein